MMTETEYLRRELIRARALLADCCGLIRVLDGEMPIPTTDRVLSDIYNFQRHPVAVMPDYVK